MSFSSSFSYLFRKYPVFRTFLLTLLIAIIIGVITIVSIQSTKNPVITTIKPDVGEPGDVLTLIGDHFGTKNTENFVEIGGSRLTSSSYLSWTNNEIKVLLPHNVLDGLVYVSTSSGKSNPKIFANKSAIPVPAQIDPLTTIPEITKVSPSTVTTGSIITITGRNFGTLRGSSQVYFATNDIDTSGQPLFITGSDFDSDYQYWSEMEIQVRVPDGASSGNLFVSTTLGSSNKKSYSLSTSLGSKSYSDKRTYLISESAQISDMGSQGEGTLTLFVPLPQTNGWQRNLEIVKSTREPSIPRYMNTIVHQTSLQEAVDKLSISHDFVISVWAVQSNIQSRNVKSYSTFTKNLYNQYVKSDSIIVSDNEKIISLASSIVNKEKNPYLQAQMIFSYVIQNIELLTDISTSELDIDFILDEKKADAYEMTILTVALMRAVGIPTLPVGGILVDADMKSQNHWWLEFYLEDLGWIPSDPALGSGMEYKAFQDKTNKSTWYFGNLDAQHIAFSRGWNNIKPAHITSQKVYRPKTFALQSIWEEATIEKLNYSSLWNNPIVIGVY